MDKIINVGLIGMGTIGSGVVSTLQENFVMISRRAEGEIKLVKVMDRDTSCQYKLPFGIEFTTEATDLLDDPNIDIIVELIGRINPAYEFICQALSNGKSVVTANKDVIAKYGRELIDLSRANNVDIMFEASVGGGIPIIRPLLQCLAANHLTAIMGIVNGTTNYMLTKMTDEGLDYDDVLKEAQEKGYAESDPTADVGGMDAARKIAILATLAFGDRVDLDSVDVAGITSIDKNDIAYARELGYVVKLLAVARDSEHGVDAKVYPAFLPQNHPLAAVNDVFNAIFAHGEPIGDVMFYGRGAGQRPTASAVVADIVDVARNIRHNCCGRLYSDSFIATKEIMPPQEASSAFYIRLLVADRPGVFATIASIFGEQQVSLHSVIQKRKIDKCAEIVLVTYSVLEKNIHQALALLEKFDAVQKISGFIRVEDDSLKIG